MSVYGLERLDVWVKAKDFALMVHKEVIPLLPNEEKWVMGQQIRRSAQSIPANIAEGYGRFYYQDNIRFCYIARGSLEESLSYLVLARDLNYIPEVKYLQLIQEGDNLVRLINGYVAYLKRNRRGANEPGASLATHEAKESYILDSIPVDLDQ